MSVLLGIHSISKSFGTRALFHNLSFTINQGDRIGLIGPNGSGKSTLLKIMAEQESPDEGSISRRRGLRIGYASQVPEFPALPLEETMMEGLAGDASVLQTRARILLGKAQFEDFSQLATTLSGGWKKRLDIVRALMTEPDLLILDEPTNHLDLEGIEWLERFLLKEKTSYIIVSHDRYFLDTIANRIIEINHCYPSGLLQGNGSLSDFMEQKEAFLQAQEQQQRGLASAVRTEVEWLRRSPKARTTKSQSRIQRAYAMLDELADLKWRNKVNTVSLEFSASERETRKLIVGKNLSKVLGGKQLFKGVDVTLSPGSRLGIVGKNGTGKTTLLRLLSKAIAPDTGTIKYANDLRLVYFDQHREIIPPETSLKDDLSPSSDSVNYRGQDIHVNGWAKRFLFSPDRLTLPVRCLSGGERARIQIARLMLEPADVLFLDEPTNDLDIPTLEVLERSLMEFPGAVVLITHDRCLMDRICTEIIGLGMHNEQTHFADYSQWEAARACAPIEKKEAPKSPKEPVAPKTTKKLSYKEQRELEGMEGNILRIEQEIVSLQRQLNAAAADAQRSLDFYHQLAEKQRLHDTLFERWQELENKSS